MNVQKLAKILEENNEYKIRGVILDTARKENQIIHGSRAFNIQSPSHLQKKTSDYDILTKKPKKSAQEVAEILRRRLNKEVTVYKGTHKGTYKLKVDNENIADYTQIKHSPKVINSWGNQVRSLKSIKQNTQRLVKNPNKEFRREKDLDTLKKIKEVERLNKFSF